MSATLPEYLRVDPDESVRYKNNGKRKLAKPGECDYCDKLRASSGPAGFFPDHDAMRGCRSGGRSHCTCNGCF